MGFVSLDKINPPEKTPNDVIDMSVNGEITSVRISRKSSLQTEGDHYDVRDEFDEVSRSRFEEGRARPRNFDGSHLQPSRGKSSKRDDHILRPDSDEINLEKLLHSVLDISEQGKKHWQANGKTFGKKQRPFSAHQLSSSKQHAHSINGDETRSCDGRSPRIRQRPISAQVISENRNNYSFSNDNVDRIDRENQRLLREIMRNQAKKSSSRQSVSRKVEPVKVKSAATVNRSRFQSQVERENLVGFVINNDRFMVQIESMALAHQTRSILSFL